MKILMKKLKNLNNKEKSNNKTPIKVQLDLLESLDLFLQRGYSLTETIDILYIKYQLQEMRELLRQGRLLSDIFALMEFDQDVLLILQIAETSGNLKNAVNKSVTLLKNKIASKDQLIEVLKYPLLLAIIMIVALGFVAHFLIPQFESIYISFGIELNLFVSIVFGIIKILPVVTSIILLIILVMFKFIASRNLDTRVKIYLKFDFIAKNYVKLYNQIFVINMTNLLLMGLRLDEILEILAQQNYNLLVQKEARRIHVELKQGTSLASAISNELYHDELILLIKEGELHNTLIPNLENYIIFAQKERESRTQKMLFLIQPIFYGVFGLLIVMLYVSIFIPMYQMMDTL